MIHTYKNQKFYSSIYHSPIGDLIIKSTDVYLLSVTFDEKFENVNKNEIIISCEKQLDEYFNGERKEFTLPIFLNGTKFQNLVWQKLTEIKYGQTISYTNFAIMIGNKNKIRAVANANSKNPFVIILPCHRVIGKNGSLVGYSGGLHRKKWLIEFEQSNSFKNKMTLF